MTSDAKLGLLVGLILIIAIVFALNGLPGIIKASQDKLANETAIKVSTEDIMSTARETVRTLVEYENPEPLPETAPEPPAQQVANSYNVEIPAEQPTTDLPAPAKKEQEYIVQANDNLAEIAKKFYGDEQGNRLVNIEKIAKHNNLKSVNFIYKGQKLIIPPIKDQSTSLTEEQKKHFVKADSFSATSKIRNIVNLPTISVINKVPGNVYVVRENDTLWSIAAKMLGNGTRYPEILKINSQLTGAADLEPGMELKLPVR